MTVLVTWNGTQYLLPTTGETGWGTVLSNFLADVATNGVCLTGSQTESNKVITLQAGAVNAPSLAFTANATSGVYQPATNQVAVTTNGVQRLLVDANGVLSIGTGGISLTGAVIEATKTSTVTAQVAVQNQSAGNSASTDFVATADNGTDTTNYIDLGINSSTYNDSGYTITGVGDGYLYTQAQNLVLGTATAGKNVVFHTGGTLTANKRLTIADAAITASVPFNAAAGNVFDGVGRNYVHNPLFNIAQRGTGPWTTAVYTADRWLSSFVTDTVSYSIAQFSDADRAAIGDEEAGSYLTNTFTGNAAAGAYNQLVQRTENVRRLAGKTVTISFVANTTSGTPKIGVNILQSFGTGGSPSASVRALSTGNAVTLSTTLTRYSTTIAIPSISGKTLGSNSDHYTQLEFWMSSGATNNAIAGNIGVQATTISIWGVQLEVGSVATQLEKPDPRYDLANCQRSYVLMPVLLISGYASGAGLGMFTDITLPTTMRAAPAVTFINQSYTNANTFGLNATTNWHIRVGCLSVAAGSVVGQADAQITADL